MKTQRYTEAQKAMISEVKGLRESNRRITESGGFFTAQQVANEKRAWPIICALRFDHNINI